MRHHHPRPKPEHLPRADGRPALTGDLEADTKAALDWLGAHEERWLTDELRVAAAPGASGSGEAA